MDRGPFRGIRAAAAAALVVRARLVQIGACRRYDIKALLLVRFSGDVWRGDLCVLLVSKLETGGVGIGNNVYYTFMLVNGRRVSVRSIFVGNGIGFCVLDRVYVILFLPIYLLPLSQQA